MSSLFSAIVWIEHAQARVIRFDGETSSTSVVCPPEAAPRQRREANASEAAPLSGNQAYLHAVVQEIEGVDTVLVAGTADARLELMKHLARHCRQLADKVIVLDTVDQPTDGQLLDMGRRHFQLSERGHAIQR